MRHLGPTTALLLIWAASGCRTWAPPIAIANRPVAGCYLLSYREWGTPPRLMGQEMAGVGAPEFLVLSTQPLRTALRDTTDPTPRFEATWYLSVQDSNAHIAQWKRTPSGEIWVGFFARPLWG